VAKPTVLLVDPLAERLRDLSHRLTAAGYEVVPVADIAKGQRFVAGLGTAVVVAAAAALASSDPTAFLAAIAAPREGAGRSLVVFSDRPDDEEELPDNAAFLLIAGLGAQEIVRRLELVLLGREIGIAPDARLASLVGDLAQTPLLELLRVLAPTGVDGRIELRGGTLTLAGGAVVAARAGAARGLKAFCRLGRLHEGPLRIVAAATATEGVARETGGGVREIEEDLHGLILAAIEDSLGELPDPRSRLELDLKPAFFSTAFTPVQQEMLGLAQRGATLQEILDTLPARDGEIVDEMLRLEGMGLLVRRAPSMARIATDSTADLPADLARAHGIAVVPLTVAFGKETFRDRVDLQPGQFYALLTKRKEHPASSPPPRQEFAARYQEWLAEGSEIVSLHLSAKLSQTFENASAAALATVAAAEPGRLTVLDTGQVSLGLGLLALFAARLAARDEPAARIVRRLREMAPRVHTLFVVDTLEYLARGGRIGKARALLGGLLRVKPILGVVDGEVAPLDQVRGGRAVHPRLLELLHRRVDRKRPLIAGICHANAPTWADSLERLVREQLQVAELIEAEVGPVIGANVGPGALAITVFQPTGDELRWIAPL
jgi:DegV family protein with EDD domain